MLEGREADLAHVGEVTPFAGCGSTARSGSGKGLRGGGTARDVRRGRVVVLPTCRGPVITTTAKTSSARCTAGARVRARACSIGGMIIVHLMEQMQKAQ